MKRILVIEEFALFRQLLCQLLQAQGHHVVAADNSLDGLQLARAKEPDLILCSTQMSEIDGYLVLAKLQQDVSTNGIPFFLLAPKMDNQEREYALQKGATGYFSKLAGVVPLLDSLKLPLVS